MANKEIDKVGKDMVVALEDFFKKGPQLPKGGQQFLVTITPWVAIIFGVIGVIFGVLAVVVSPVGIFGGPRIAFDVLLSGVLLLLSSVLMVMAFPKLQKHAFSGWMLLFWSEVVHLINNLVHFDLLGLIIGGLIGFFILFQIRSYYK